LRKVLDRGCLLTQRPGYLLRVRAGNTDVDRVEEFRRQARDHDAGKAAELLSEALALWRGEPLADLAYDRFAQLEIGRLEELRPTVLEERIEADLALGRHADLVSELEELVGRYPLRERLRGELMLALYRCDRQAEALQVFQVGHRALADELGLEPSPALQALQRAILNHDHELEAPRQVTPRATRRRRPLIALVVGFAALLGAGLVARAATRDGRAARVSVESNSVAVIDPRTNSVVADIGVGDRPTKMVTLGRDLWVLNASSGTVSRIDRQSQKVVRTLAIGHAPSDIAVGANALWIGESTTRTLERIDLETGARTGAITPRVPPTPRLRDAGDVAFGAGDVWFASGHGTLARVDPATMRVKALITNLYTDPGGQIIARSNAVWIADGWGNFTHVDPQTNKVVGYIAIAADRAEGIAGGPGRIIWATDQRGSVWQIDAERDSAIASFRVRAAPAGVTVGAASVWTANSGDGTVSRLNPRTGRTTTIKLGGSPDRLAFSDGLVWVGID
jgi:YVTN family beta-propeller protein